MFTNPNPSTWELLIALIFAYFLFSGFSWFERILKHLLGLGASFKFRWYHKIFTIPLYLILYLVLVSFLFDPIDTVLVLIEILSKIKTWGLWKRKNWMEIFSQLKRKVVKIWRK